MSETERIDRRIENTLFLAAIVAYAYFYQAADQSIAARFDLIRSILERHTLWIDGFCGYNTADIIQVGGHYFSVKAPGTSLTGLVPWSFVTWFLAPLASRNESLFWAFATYLTIVLTVSLLVAIATVVMYRLGKALGVSQGRSAAAALIMALGTILFPYATEMTGEPVAAVCLISSFYLLVTFPDETPRAFYAGFLAGWAVLNDFPSILVALGLTFYALSKFRRWGHVFAFGIGASLVGGILMFYNWGAFGHPFFMSYQAYGTPGNEQFPEQAVGFVGVTYPKLRLLWNTLVDPQRGLLFANPVLLMMIPGFVYFWRSGRRAECLLTLWAVIVFVAFNASFGESIISWGGGTATGPRQVTPAVPFMVLPIMFLPPALDYLTTALAGVSVLYMLAATSTNPHLPYEYENPIWQFSLPHYFHADFAFNQDRYFGGDTIVADSVAFNLGKLVRLPGPAQLLPLAVFWIACAGELIEDLALWGGAAREWMGTTAAFLLIWTLFIPPMTSPMRQTVALRRSHGLLARYFVGNQPGEGPPHLIRVDQAIDFDDVAQLGAMPFPSTVVWSGTLLVPRPGIYRFTIVMDDTGWLKIDDHDVIPDPGVVMRPELSGLIELRPGPHRIVVGERNVAGGASAKLFWQPPGMGQQIVPSSALIPDRLDNVR